jgi:DNA repair protein RecN (Recombination protein N)
MLRKLKVRDLALVASAEVHFGPGLNLLTGETGSGKSLIVDALGLTLGARASTEQVRHGAEKAFVETVFARGDGGALVLAREVGQRSAARIDGRPSTPSQLREAGRTLVGVHGQHEHQALMDAEAQTLLLDAYAGALDTRQRLGELYEEFRLAEQRLRDLERLRARGRREEEYLRWQLDELRRADLRPGEDEELLAQRSVARNAAQLAELTGLAGEALRGDSGVATAVTAARSAGAIDSRLEAVARRLETLEQESLDLAQELRKYAESIDADPARLEGIESRLAQLESIKRKYGGSLEQAIEERKRLESQLGASEDLDGALESAERVRNDAWIAVTASAAELSRRRTEGAAALASAVSAELTGLRLEGARFEVALRPREVPGPDGGEQAEMMFSANPGEPLRPLARVASGGELARVMLAIKTAGAEADSLPTLIFDEVDAGIGGEAALQVGVRLKALGARRQVLVVTHLAQIACFADHHLVVEKVPGAEGRNLVRVRELRSEADRAAELARMMSGGVTESALARAHELLAEARY